MYDADTSEEKLRSQLDELAKMRQWIFLGIVGADLRTINHTLTNEEVSKRLKAVGGAIGILGLTFFRDSLQVYYKPLTKGTGTLEKLDRVGRRVMAVALEHLKRNPLQGEA